MTAYINFMFGLVVALVVTGMALLLLVAVGGMLHALYKGATDPKWR